MALENDFCGKWIRIMFYPTYETNILGENGSFLEMVHFKRILEEFYRNR
jgi:hypothetical protein